MKELKKRIPAIIVAILIIAYVYLLIYSISVDNYNEKLLDENIKLESKIVTQKIRIEDLMLECKND